jgi:hypothetical protein
MTFTFTFTFTPLSGREAQFLEGMRVVAPKAGFGVSHLHINMKHFKPLH